MKTTERWGFRIPLRKCRRCARYAGQCSLIDLDPCSFVERGREDENIDEKEDRIGWPSIVFCIVASGLLVWLFTL